MRPVTQRLSAADFSPWVPLNRLSKGVFAVGLGVVISSGASLTYSVQQTMDNVYDRTEEFSVARVTTTGTVTLTNHGLSVDDWVLFSGAAAPFNTAKGFAVASVVDANSFTVTVANSGITSIASGSGVYLHKARVQAHDTMAAETTSQTGNYAFPPFATRFIITTYASGFADFTIISAG